MHVKTLKKFNLYSSEVSLYYLSEMLKPFFMILLAFVVMGFSAKYKRNENFFKILFYSVLFGFSFYVLREVINKYNVSNSDVIKMSEIRHEMKKVGFWKKESLRGEFRNLTSKKNGIKLIDFTQFYDNLIKLEPITSENIDNFFYTKEELLEIRNRNEY